MTLFTTVRNLHLCQQDLLNSSELNTKIEKLIGCFSHLDKLKVSCVYNPLVALLHTKPGQVDKLKMIVDKRISNEYLAKLSKSCMKK